MGAPGSFKPVGGGFETRRHRHGGPLFTNEHSGASGDSRVSVVSRSPDRRPGTPSPSPSPGSKEGKGPPKEEHPSHRATFPETYRGTL